MHTALFLKSLYEIGYLKLLVGSSWHNTETTSSFVSRYETTSRFELVVVAATAA